MTAHADDVVPGPVGDRAGGATIVALDSVSKHYEGRYVLRDVSFGIAEGELVALLGPNGAGKSTLIKILDGVVRQDAGTIRVRGSASSSARASEVGVVHQDLGLVGSLSVLDNVSLGLAPAYRIRPVLSRAAERARARAALEHVGLEHLDLRRNVEELTAGEQALVAIAKLFARGSRLIVVDEVTSTLPPKDAHWLLGVLKSRVTEGAAVLMVTHKMSEVYEAATRQVVLVDGQLVADAHDPLLSRNELVAVMRQHESAAAADPVPGAATSSSLVSAAREPTAPSRPPALSFREARSPRFGPFTFDLHPGEAIGITGLVGSGLYDIAYLAAGIEPVCGGEMTLAPKLRRALVPPHREIEANFPEDSVLVNMTSAGLFRWRNRFGLIDAAAERAAAEAMSTELSVVPPDLRARQHELSGGNQQKVILGRALLRDPDLLILCEPTRGVDVGTRAEITRKLRALKAAGMALLVVSTDLEDIYALSDWIGVVEDGACEKVLPAGSKEAEQLAYVL